MRERFEQFLEDIMELKRNIIALKRYKSNKTYLTKYKKQIKKINKGSIYLYSIIEKTKSIPKDKAKKLKNIIKDLFEAKTYDIKLNIINKIELFWPELEVEFEDFNIQSFEIPKEIPMNESRLDLEEAIKDYDNGCFISSIVMCRRSYEGVLLELYKTKEQKDPIIIKQCKKCKNQLGKGYIGISNLHKWVINKGIINEKFRNVGFLISDLGAGGAHPPLKEFPREKDIAKISITTLIALLKQIYKNY